jgi:hypothetical protein
VLDDRIDEFVEIFQGAYAIDDFGDPAATTEVQPSPLLSQFLAHDMQEEVYVVGRIALETESAGVGAARLNEASIALESSRMNGSGARVPVRFAPDARIRGGAHGTGGLGLFPGEIVALRGRNGGGGWFQASELISVRDESYGCTHPTDVVHAFLAATFEADQLQGGSRRGACDIADCKWAFYCGHGHALPAMASARAENA